MIMQMYLLFRMEGDHIKQNGFFRSIDYKSMLKIVNMNVKTIALVKCIHNLKYSC